MEPAGAPVRSGRLSARSASRGSLSTLGREQPYGLAEEERIALGLVGDRGDELGRWPDRRRQLDERRDLALLQAAEEDAATGKAGDVVQGRVDRLSRFDIRLPLFSNPTRYG